MRWPSASWTSPSAWPSALDANVECVGNKVFALTRIDELTEAERSYLRTQGII